MAAPAFSRLQLAAALIEYDNDPEDPTATYRSAHDSAIFAHLRQNGLMRPPGAPRRAQSDYLGVSVPSESGSVGGRESALGNRRSRGSLDALRNPFGNGTDELVDEGDDESHENLEVDLASWGLDAFMPKEKSSKGKGKAKLDRPSTIHDDSSRPQHSRAQSDFTNRSSARHRSMSLGNMEIQEDGSIPIHPEENRRRSLGSPLGTHGVEIVQFEGPSPDGTPVAVPFPSKSIRSPSPAPSHALSDSARNRVNSSGTMQTTLDENNPFALEPPKHASRFDPKAALHARTMSNASMGSRVLVDNDGASAMTGLTGQHRDRPYSTVELLRPKVLVMPSPLQSANLAGPLEPTMGREGFEISTDGPPLPPGARSSRPMSSTLGMLGSSSSLAPPVPSNSFIPNPRTNLTLSQLTFRNQLMVGGQRDVAYADLERDLPRATEEGQQVQTALPDQAPDLPLPPEDPAKKGRPAGKLYGTSLIDRLESRKLEMRNKQRVFTGDQRPSMMARGQPTRSSTLIDPASLQVPPQNRKSTFGIPEGPQHNLARRNSSNIKPLLNFDDETQALRPPTQVINSRSVFGVDTLWEREMAKLKEIQEQEKIEAEAREKEEALDAERKSKKKGKKKGKSKESPQPQLTTPQQDELAPRVSAEPPMLPDIPKAVRRPPPPPADDEDGESEDSDDVDTPAKQPNAVAAVKGWDSSDDDEDQGPRRTTGTGPRYPSKAIRRESNRQDYDSDEDTPLSVAIDRAVHKTANVRDDSDEEKPLAALLPKPANLSRIPRSSNERPAVTDDDDDNQPLGLRASRAVLSMGGEGGDDDDTPLGLHPEQQRRTQQHHMMIQAQQQHQIMMQAQNSMFFNPAMMGNGFFGPQVPPMMVPAPIPIPSPPPLHDAQKYGRVDRWRHDVAVEGTR